MQSYVLLAAWTVLAGAGIPLIGVLNSGVARSVGNPITPTAITFAIATVVAVALTLPFYGFPAASQLGAAPLLSYAPGLIIGFYALSATIIIPRFGAASFVAYILIAQLLTSAVVDQFGLFGMQRRSIDTTKLIGLGVIVIGIVILEIGNLRKTPRTSSRDEVGPPTLDPGDEALSEIVAQHERGELIAPDLQALMERGVQASSDRVDDAANGHRPLTRHQGQPQ